MPELLARWWAHRKLHRGQCEACGRALPDDTPKVNGHRTCSEECALDLWTHLTA